MQFVKSRLNVVKSVVFLTRMSVTSESSYGPDGFMRSLHCKPEIKGIVRDGKVIKFHTGLVDQTVKPLGDQFVELHAKLTYKHDLTMKSLYDWIADRMKQRNRIRQIVSNEAVQHLGVDLAVAHMICNIGGRVQFMNNDKWYFSYAGLSPGLPRRYMGDLKIESIDLSGTTVVYEGFELLPQLTELRFLRLKRCVHVDDFCMSRVGRIANLQLLDVGECPRVTSKGLAALSQSKNLRHLLVHNNPLMEDKELVCLLLEDHLPKLFIDGVDYIEALPDESRQRIVALISDESVSTIPKLANPSQQDEVETENPEEPLYQKGSL